MERRVRSRCRQGGEEEEDEGETEEGRNDEGGMRRRQRGGTQERQGVQFIGLRSSLNPH